jgi:hypothetical protein
VFFLRKRTKAGSGLGRSVTRNREPGVLFRDPTIFQVWIGHAATKRLYKTGVRCDNVADMKRTLRRLVAITVAYTVVLHGLLALVVIASHVPGASDGVGLSTCMSAGPDSGDAHGSPGRDQANCLQHCLAGANTIGCDPGDRRSAPLTVVRALPSVSPVDEAARPAAPTTAANGPRAPPA